VDKVANVFFNGRLAGALAQHDGRYFFTYDPEYLAGGTPLSFHLPLQKAAFEGEDLFPFFENLTSEGWLRSIQATTQKIDESDRLGLLIVNGIDLVGAVTIERVS
jgi:serine/threonine-protein kinase HipA